MLPPLPRSAALCYDWGARGRERPSGGVKVLRYLKNVVTLQLDEAKCTGCGVCATVCPHGVLALEGGKARIRDRDACIECGACSRNCPSEAVDVEAGVGCATGIIFSAFRRSDVCCGDKPCCG